MQRPTRDNPNEASAPPSMYTPAQMRLLKIAVIGMGVVLLLGFATVIGRIVYLVNSSPRPSVSAVAGNSALPKPLKASPLPKGAVVRHIALSGDRLAIHFESPSGAGIQIVDLSRGGEAVTLPLAEETGR